MKKDNIYDVAIVGAGSMGMAAGAYLAEKGAKTLLLDAFNPPHDYGSHHGDTRMIRHAYGEGREYVSLVKRAQVLWEELEARTSHQIFEKTGVVGVGPKDSAFLLETIEAAKNYQLPLEVLNSKEVNEKWPGFEVPEHFIGCYEAESGFIYSNNAVQAYKEIAIEYGATIRTNSPVDQIEKISDNIFEIKSQGLTYNAKTVIVTAGAWVKKVLPNVPLQVTPTRKAFGWFEAPEALYDRQAFPSFYVEDGDYMCYGFPSLDGSGLKIGRSDSGQPIDPDKHSQNFGEVETDETDLRFFLERYLPKANGELRQGKTCLYTNSSDTHFIIDKHPDDDGMIIACGFSGHGFKFASSIGEALGELALTGKSTIDLSRFSLARFE